MSKIVKICFLISLILRVAPFFVKNKSPLFLTVIGHTASSRDAMGNTFPSCGDFVPLGNLSVQNPHPRENSWRMYFPLHPFSQLYTDT